MLALTEVSGGGLKGWRVGRFARVITISLSHSTCLRATDHRGPGLAGGLHTGLVRQGQAEHGLVAGQAGQAGDGGDGGVPHTGAPRHVGLSRHHGLREHWR